ncbi:hypothetical protein BDQ17DRAFT_1311661 [Cyathus striatus]|nr:hypothetical protein BDQ17DRAFT_1311661 [Cyathus striatus]
MFLKIYLNNISVKLLEQSFPDNSCIVIQCLTSGSEHDQICRTKSLETGSGNVITWSTPLFAPLHAAEFTMQIILENINDSSRVDIGSILFKSDELLRRIAGNPHIVRRLQGGWKAEISCDISVSPVAWFILVFRLALQWVHDSLSAQRIADLENKLKEAKSNKSLEEPLLLSLSSEVYSLPTNQPKKSLLLNLLGDLYWNRYLSSPRDAYNLNEAIRIYADAVQLATDDDINRAGHLNDLAAAYLRRFEQFGNPDDLNAAMKHFEETLDFTRDDDIDKPLRMSNHGNALNHHFKRSGDDGSLNKAIEVQREAVDVSASRNAQQPFLIHNLATSLDLRFERYGKLEDLSEAISLHEQAVESCMNEREKLKYLTTLTNSLYNRFERKRALNDLDRVVNLREEVIQLTPEDNPAKPGRLNNLANAFLRRFEYNGNIADLERSVSMLEKANDLTLNEHPDKLSRMNNLASAYIRRYAQLSKSIDLDSALELFEGILRRTTDGHPQRPARLSTLAGALARRFEGADPGIADINRAIELQGEAVRLTPDDGAKKASRINALANFLRRRFESLRNVEDIDSAISNAESAVKLTSADNPEKFGFLNMLGVSLAARFDTFGSIDDINRSISVLRMSVRLTADSDREKPARLDNLGASLWSRFKRLGDVGDLKESVQAHERAVMLTPKDHPSRAMRLNNFGNALTRCFRRLNNIEDIDRSISVKEEALQLLPENHPQRMFVLDGLANSLFRHYVVTLKKEDIDRSIIMHEESLHNTPQTHPSRSARLSNLGNSLSSRFEQQKDIVDIDRAISLQEDAVSSTPDGNLNKVAFLINLGNSYARRSLVTGTPDDLIQACLNFSLAAKSSTGSAVVKFRACSHWAQYSRVMHATNLLDIYEHAVSLLPQLAWLGLPITDRFHHLVEAGRVIRDGASVAIEAGDLRKAVEWLEQGRSVIWGQLLQLRTPLDRLRDVRPDLANKLTQLSLQLEGTSVDSQVETVESNGRESVQQYHSLAIERDNLIGQIRSEIEGFDRFLQPQSFSELTYSLPNHVVIVNVSSVRCDALVISSKSSIGVSLIPLPDLTLSKVQTMYKYLRILITSSGRSIDQQLDIDSRSSSIAPAGAATNDEGFAKLLTFIWTIVVKPVLTGLEISVRLNL